MNDWIAIGLIVTIITIVIGVMWMGNDYDEW